MLRGLCSRPREGEQNQRWNPAKKEGQDHPQQNVAPLFLRHDTAQNHGEQPKEQPYDQKDGGENERHYTNHTPLEELENLIFTVIFL